LNKTIDFVGATITGPHAFAIHETVEEGNDFGMLAIEILLDGKPAAGVPLIRFGESPLALRAGPERLVLLLRSALGCHGSCSPERW
jgi:hypothetical protein